LDNVLFVLTNVFSLIKTMFFEMFLRTLGVVEGSKQTWVL